MDIEKVSGSTYRLADRLGKINVGLIVTQDGALLVDTGSSVEMGQEIKRLAAEVTSHPVVYVVNTHHHADHVGGNAAFGVPILSHVSCFHHMAGPRRAADPPRGANTAGRPAARQDGSSLPSVCFTDRGYLMIGGMYIELYHTPGHTDGSVVVNIPSEKVLFGGDTVSLDPVQVDPGSDLGRWADSMTIIRRLAPRHVIPGRSDVFGYDGLDALDETLRAQIQQGSGRGAMPRGPDASGLIRLAPRSTGRSGSVRPLVSGRKMTSNR